MLKNICPTEECTGCMACLNACANSAINIVTDKLGFRYPMINSENCTNCGLCQKVCPQINHRTLVEPIDCFAAALKEFDNLLTSASGGAATALSIATIRQGGVVVGCSGEDMRYVRHIMVDSIDGLQKLKGSKYVQSEISAELFRDIRRELIKGRKVLFIGTGCQVAGLQNFLMKPFENLITVDLVCHGVPSQQMLNENINQYPEIDPNSVKFRIKKPKANGGHAICFGWSATTHSKQNSKHIFKPWYRDHYLAAFLDCISFRQCCYNCLYATSKRQSDLTIADFWGLGRDSSLAKAAGVSLILVNTTIGANVVQQISDLLKIEQRPVIEAVRGNGQLIAPSQLNPKRALFEKLYTSHGFISAVEATSFQGIYKRHLKQQFSLHSSIILQYMPKSLKSFIKKCLGWK